MPENRHAPHISNITTLKSTPKCQRCMLRSAVRPGPQLGLSRKKCCGALASPRSVSAWETQPKMASYSSVRASFTLSTVCDLSDQKLYITVQMALCQSVLVMLNGLATCPFGTFRASIAALLHSSRNSVGASFSGLVDPLNLFDMA